MNASYELYLHHLSNLRVGAGAVGLEATPLPLWFRLGLPAIAGLVVALSLLVG